MNRTELIKSAIFLKINFLIIFSFLVLLDANAVSVKPFPKEPGKAKSFKRVDLEKRLGRKLKFGERILFRILKKKINKKKKKEKTWANTAFWISLAGLIPYVGLIFGLAGFFIGIASLFNTKYVKRKEKHLFLAILAILLGLIFVILNVMLISFLNYSFS